MSGTERGGGTFQDEDERLPIRGTASDERSERATDAVLTPRIRASAAPGATPPPSTSCRAKEPVRRLPVTVEAARQVRKTSSTSPTDRPSHLASETLCRSMDVDGVSRPLSPASSGPSTDSSADCRPTSPPSTTPRRQPGSARPGHDPSRHRWWSAYARSRMYRHRRRSPPSRSAVRRKFKIDVS